MEKVKKRQHQGSYVAFIKEKGRLEYKLIHDWVKEKYGVANKCEICGGLSKKSNTYDWALKRGYEYEKKRKNFLMLCRSCHLHYDEHLKHKRRAIRQYSLDGKLIKEHVSIKSAARSIQKDKGHIIDVIKGRQHTAYGFVWKYKINP